MVYTRTGDAGTTSLVGGTRVSKSSPRLDAYGTVDELNSHIGLLLAMDGVPPEVNDTLERVQHKLFNLGAELATEPESKWQPTRIVQGDVDSLEHAIDQLEEKLPKHHQFILPGGILSAAQSNVARTVARRAERRMVEMVEQGITVEEPAMKFMNRLSDYLFVAGRYCNIYAGKNEFFWIKDC